METVVDLVPDGRDVAVTDDNKLEYVNLVAAHKMTNAIKEQIAAFTEGFNDIVPHEIISILNPSELELLISGTPEIDIDDLKNNTEYVGYTTSAPQVRWFWEVVKDLSEEDRARKQAVRQDFLDNLTGSDYCLALRGKGNYSFRFYEIFSIWRIPVFVDTRCVLPFEDRVDWRKHCVWVDEKDVDRVDEVVAQFHADIHEDDFRALQLANRDLWVEWLSPAAIYERILADALQSDASAAGS